MAAYIIVNVEVTDTTRYADYTGWLATRSCHTRAASSFAVVKRRNSKAP